MSAGYSKRFLVDKLGIKAEMKVAFIGAPKNYSVTLDVLPPGVKIVADFPTSLSDFIHFFTKSKKELEDAFPRLKKFLTKNGFLWISWPKLSSKVATDLNENIVREIGLVHGLVDVKVCAIDETWSGLKFVFRLKDR